MSASRERKNRQDLAGSGWSDPKTAREAQQRKETHRSNILYGVIGVVFVIALAGSLIWRSNIIQKISTAATIDGEKYTAAEVTFHYQSVYRNFLNNYYYYLSYLGVDTSSDIGSQTISESAAAMLGDDTLTDKTWKDYFLDTALDQMAQIQAALADAEANGFTYPAGVQAEYEDSMAELKTTASASAMTVNQYLAAYLGSGMTEKVYGEQLLRTLQYSAYVQNYQDELTYTDAELEEAYAASPDTYDKVSYEYVMINGSADSTTDDEGNTVDPTEEESAAALEAAKTAADEMLAAYQSGGDLSTLADANDKASYFSGEDGSYSTSTLMSWMFDSSRKAGDCEVLESGSNYYVAVFRDRYRNENKTIDVRHILFQIDDSALDTESDTYDDDLQALKDEAKAKAEDMLSQWQSGEATEDSFAQLALEYSEDSGSKYEGGLYTQVYEGQMVTEFNDWCFDDSRQPGDTGVVYGEATDSYMGYHVMYFVGDDLAEWAADVSDDLKTEATNTWVDAFGADADIQQGSGIKYVS